MKKLIACIALLLAVFGLAEATNVTPVSAYLSTCSTYYYPGKWQYGAGAGSVCYNHVNNGGNNLQRVRMTCRKTGGYAIYRYGPWVLEDYTSFAYCASDEYVDDATYQLL